MERDIVGIIYGICMMLFGIVLGIINRKSFAENANSEADFWARGLTFMGAAPLTFFGLVIVFMAATNL